MPDKTLAQVVASMVDSLADDWFCVDSLDVP